MGLFNTSKYKDEIDNLKQELDRKTMEFNNLNWKLKHRLDENIANLFIFNANIIKLNTRNLMSIAINIELENKMNSLISQTEETIQYLSEILIQSNVEIESNKTKVSLDKDINYYSNTDNKICIKFHKEYFNEFNTLEEGIFNSVKLAFSLFITSNSKESIDDAINACETTINLFETLKTFCYSKGKGGKIYFDNMWDYQDFENPDFNYLTPVKILLNELKSKKEETSYE